MSTQLIQAKTGEVFAIRVLEAGVLLSPPLTHQQQAEARHALATGEHFEFDGDYVEEFDIAAFLGAE